MGKKLSSNESLASIQAVQEYLREYSRDETMLVIAKQGYNVLFKGKIKVIIGVDSNYYDVNVIWEDENYDYHADGLIGYYRTEFCKMRYSEGILNIFFDGNIEITITR